MTFVTYANSRPTELVKADYSKIDSLLVSLLSRCTPHKYESHIIDIIKSQKFVKENARTRMFDKEMNNQIIFVGESSTLFSCHMDIVGQVSKYNSDKNRVDSIFLMEEQGNITKSGIYYGAKGFYNNANGIDKYEGCPLGADDKVGVYILLKMIEAKIPGMYVFHTGEECGGLGSASLAAKHPKLFTNIQRAIAFDRADYGDIISYQRNSRCCSKEFGEAFAEVLNKTMPPKQKFSSEVRGTFTDTASYTKLIPECTNVSVGYFSQHGQNEHFDYIWLQNYLLPAILSIDYEKLPIKRDPKAIETTTSYSYGNHWNNQHSNIKKKSWKEATSTTPYMEFPEWHQKLGFVEEADPVVLQTAVGRYLSTLTYGQPKTEFVEWLCNLMEFNAILQDEIVSIRATLDRVIGNKWNNTHDKSLLETIVSQSYLFDWQKARISELTNIKKDSNIVPLLAKPKSEEEILAEYCNFSEKEKNIIQAKFNILTKPQKEDERESLLIKMILAAEDKSIVLYGPYKQWLSDYVEGARKFLKRHTGPYTEKDINKYNRILFAIATLVDCSEVHTKEVEELLIGVDKYITEHSHEEGFEVNERLIRKEDDLIERKEMVH